MQKVVGLAEVPSSPDAVGSLPDELALMIVEYASFRPASAYCSACKSAELRPADC